MFSGTSRTPSRRPRSDDYGWLWWGLLLFIPLAVLGIAIAILVIVAIHAGKAVKCKNVPESVECNNLPEPAFKCPPFSSPYAWSYQDPDTCLETWRIGIWFDVRNETNLAYVNLTAVKDFIAVLEPWMLENFAPYYQRTVKVSFFTPSDPPIGNDWTPYIIHYINDVNAVNLGACDWHWVHSPGISNFFQLGSMADVIGPDAPLPPPGWPVISSPIGLEGTDNDGAWYCLESMHYFYGAQTTIWDTFTTGITHEYFEKLFDWNSAQWVSAQSNFSAELGTVQFFIMENADPVAWFDAPRLQTRTYNHYLSNFVFPAFFGGCMDSNCAPPAGPLDYMHVLTSPFECKSGGASFLSYNATSGELDSCFQYQFDYISPDQQYLCGGPVGPYMAPIGATALSALLSQPRARAPPYGFPPAA